MGCAHRLHENGIEIHEVSYERRLWPRASSLVEKETVPFWEKWDRTTVNA